MKMMTLTKIIIWAFAIGLILIVVIETANAESATITFTDAEDMRVCVDSIWAVEDTTWGDPLLRVFECHNPRSKDHMLNKILPSWNATILEIANNYIEYSVPKLHSITRREPGCVAKATEPKTEIYYSPEDRDRKRGTYIPGAAYLAILDLSYPKHDTIPGTAVVWWQEVPE